MTELSAWGWQCPDCGAINSNGVDTCACTTKTAPKRSNKPITDNHSITTSNAPKQRSKRVVIDGITFGSTGEGKRYLFLKTLASAGVIEELQCHPKWEIIPTLEMKEVRDSEGGLIRKAQTQRAQTYEADFSYMYNGVHIVEDYKATYGNSVRNQRLNRVGKPIVTDQARNKHKRFNEMYHDKLVFRIVTSANEGIVL